VVSNPGNEVRYFDLTPFADLLHPGVNTIAVALKNVWASDWDDIAFDMDLKAVTSIAVQNPSLDISTEVVYGIQNYPGGGGPIPFVQISLNASVPPNTVWRVESADTLSGPWQLVDVVSNTLGGVLSVIDTGQNGRLAPWVVGARFYRLTPN
jgi:hypothetical protein